MARKANAFHQFLNFIIIIAIIAVIIIIIVTLSIMEHLLWFKNRSNFQLCHRLFDFPLSFLHFPGYEYDLECGQDGPEYDQKGQDYESDSEEPEITLDTKV